MPKIEIINGNRDYHIQKEPLVYRIFKIRMDLHRKNGHLFAMEPTIGTEDRILGKIQIFLDDKEVCYFVESLKMKLSPDSKYSIECGDDAGRICYTLYHQLTDAEVKCVILHRQPCLSSRESKLKRG